MRIALFWIVGRIRILKCFMNHNGPRSLNFENSTRTDFNAADALSLQRSIRTGVCVATQNLTITWKRFSSTLHANPFALNAGDRIASLSIQNATVDAKVWIRFGGNKCVQSSKTFGKVTDQRRHLNPDKSRRTNRIGIGARIARGLLEHHFHARPQLAPV